MKKLSWGVCALTVMLIIVSMMSFVMYINYSSCRNFIQLLGIMNGIVISEDGKNFEIPVSSKKEGTWVAQHLRYQDEDSSVIADADVITSGNRQLLVFARRIDHPLVLTVKNLIVNYKVAAGDVEEIKRLDD